MPVNEIDINEITIDELSARDLKDQYLVTNQDHELIRKVVEARKRIGLTQRGLAEKIGVSQQEISRFENERHIPKLSNFLRIIDAVSLEIRLESKQTLNKHPK